MKGFKNMKKIVAVLVLALVAMTAVFAATTAETRDGDLKVTLSVAGYTRFGFTDDTVVGKSFTEITSATDKSVANKTDANNTIKFYASVISTNQGGATVTLTLPDKLKNINENVTDTIAIEYVNKPSNATYTVNGGATIVRDSQLIEFFVENYDNKTSGNYEATFVMTVKAL